MNNDKLEAFITQKMDEEHIAGLAIGISQNGKAIFQKGFGFRDIGLQLPVTPETIFGIASVTKSFTALAILELEDRGLLSVMDPVTKHLPDLTIKGVQNIGAIKVHHLLSHTTGLAPMERKEELCQFSEHMKYMAQADNDILGEPGEYFSYCNDTFLLLGAIIEKLTCQPYRSYMKSYFLDARDMTRSTFNLDQLRKMENVSIPYNFNPKTNRLEMVDWPTLGNYEVGGGIRSNIVDLLNYGHIFLDEEFDFTKKMWQPVIQYGRDSYYGYALNVSPNYQKNVTLVHHNGGQPGVSSHFGFIPEKNIVVTVLTNVGGVNVGDIWYAAVNAVLGLPFDYRASYEPSYEPQIEEKRILEGKYISKEGSTTLIQLVNGVLIAEMDGTAFELRMSEPDRVVLKSGKAMKFYFQDNGQPWALFNGSRMLLRAN
ncbi:serine hydrolase domain-containing protein [Pseudoneobacillus sp. C159]